MGNESSIVELYFKKYVERFIFNDVRTAIKGKANYLAALGILAYIDYLAKLSSSDSDSLGREGEDAVRKRYIGFLRRYMKEYKPYSKVYEVRNGFVHQYFPPRIRTVSRREAGRKFGNTGPAIYQREGKWVVVVEPLFEDFKKAALEAKRDMIRVGDSSFVEGLKRLFETTESEVLQLSGDP